MRVCYAFQDLSGRHVIYATLLAPQTLGDVGRLVSSVTARQFTRLLHGNSKTPNRKWLSSSLDSLANSVP